jgi:hypothetical protein
MSPRTEQGPLSMTLIFHYINIDRCGFGVALDNIDDINATNQ